MAIKILVKYFFMRKQIKDLLKSPVVHFLFWFHILTSPAIIAQTAKGLVGYWRFDEKNGVTTLDEVSRKTDSIHYIFNTTKPSHDPVRRKGISKEALVFDGFSSWIVRPFDKFTTPTNAITISVWVAPRAFEHGDAN